MKPAYAKVNWGFEKQLEAVEVFLMNALRPCPVRVLGVLAELLAHVREIYNVREI